MAARDRSANEAIGPVPAAVRALPTPALDGVGEGPGPEVRLALRVLLALPGPAAPTGAVVVAAVTATQEGLASRLAVTQGAVSKVLRQLQAAGVIRRDQGHVTGFLRRVRVYSLTPRGLDLVRAYHRRFGDGDPGPTGVWNAR